MNLHKTLSGCVWLFHFVANFNRNSVICVFRIALANSAQLFETEGYCSRLELGKAVSVGKIPLWGKVHLLEPIWQKCCEQLIQISFTIYFTQRMLVCLQIPNITHTLGVTFPSRKQMSHFFASSHSEKKCWGGHHKLDQNCWIGSSSLAHWVWTNSHLLHSTSLAFELRVICLTVVLAFFFFYQVWLLSPFQQLCVTINIC